MTVIRILLADDHAITREGTRRFLEAEHDLEVVAEAADGVETVRLAEALHPDILLLDISMPYLDGIQVVRALGVTIAAMRIVVLTGYDNRHYVQTLVRLGVKGYLSKATSSSELVAALRAIHGGGMYLQTQISAQIPSQATSLEDPTPRELEVLRLAAEGLRNREIAAQLATSERTVKFHLGNLFGKLQVASRTEMTAQARRRGWLS